MYFSIFVIPIYICNSYMSTSSISSSRSSFCLITSLIFSLTKDNVFCFVLKNFIVDFRLTNTSCGTSVWSPFCSSFITACRCAARTVMDFLWHPGHGTNILTVVNFAILMKDNNVLLVELLYDPKMLRYTKIALRCITRVCAKIWTTFA